MRDDEQAIRELFATWQRAAAASDLPKLLNLMAENVIFLVPGQPPMRGRDTFAVGFQTVLQSHRIESGYEIEEIQIAGDWRTVGVISRCR